MTIRAFALLVALTIGPWCVPVSAQHLAHGASGLAHGIPDFCELATDRILVPAGEARTLSGAVETSCLGIHGTVTVASNTTIRLDNLLLYPAGTIIIGTADQPATGVDILIRDRPLDLTKDPEQFGQGVIGFGTVRIHGTPASGEAPRSIRIRSENPNGVRGHILLTQRADIDIRYAGFFALGRTRSDGPPDSAVFSSDALERTGTNQIGRYSLHLHHVMGPLPAKARQFTLVGNLIQGDSKWGIALHNSHFGLIQNNVCVDAIGACYVEEDGSETDNHWIGNYAGRIANPAFPDVKHCIGGQFGVGYDPFGLCASGFWLRGMNNVLLNNVVEDARVGIGWWPRCLEAEAFNCGNTVLTVPLFPGADTTDPAQLVKCNNQPINGDTRCYTNSRPGLRVDGNVMRRVKHGLEHWWAQRLVTRAGVPDGQVALKGSPPITNTVMEDVDTPIHQNYSDVAYDGLTATQSGPYRGTAWEMFNDGQPIGMGQGPNSLRNAVIGGYEYVWSRAGQLDHPPFLTIADSVLQTTKGINLTWGGQGNGDAQDFRVTNTRFEAPAGQPVIAFSVSNAFEAAPNQRITTTVTAFQGNAADNFTITSPNEASPCQATRPEVVGGFVCASGAAPVPTPTPTPTPTPVPPPPPPPVDPCVTQPLKLTGVKWPSAQTGNKSGTWNSGTFTLVEVRFLWGPQRLIATDTRGCTVTVAR